MLMRERIAEYLGRCTMDVYLIYVGEFDNDVRVRACMGGFS